MNLTDSELNQSKKEFTELTNSWRGKLIDHMTISSGYVTWEEALNMTIHQIAVLADKRMYDNKTKYYQRKGFDRRGQKDAHVALYAMYTKILKVNLTEDEFQVVNMKEDEYSPHKGYSDVLSKWMQDFAASGQIHPDDVEEYLAKTNIDSLRSYFRSGNVLLRLFYRRKKDDGYVRVMMEMIPATNYRDDAQNLFLYVKDVNL